MTISKVKISALIVIACLLLAVPASVIFFNAADSSPPAKASIASQPSDVRRERIGDPLDQFKNIYSPSREQVLVYVPDASADVRNAYLQSTSRRGLDGAIRTLTLCYDDGIFIPWTMSSGHVPVAELCRDLFSFFKVGVNVPAELNDVVLPGDWAFAANAPVEEFLPAFQRILEQHTGRRFTLSLQPAEREVIVLRGRWSHPTSAPIDTDRVINFAPQSPAPSASANDASGTSGPTGFASYLGYCVGQFVICEADNLPSQIHWRYGSHPRSREEKTAILDHVAAQTGLTWNVETRPIRWLVIETARETPTNR